MEEDKISLIIPAFNEEKHIYNLLVSIEIATKYVDKEVELILVDNNCTDSTLELVETFNDVHIIQEERHNIAAVRNTGALYATGSILCFIDADSVISENALYEINKYMSTGAYVGGGMKMFLDSKKLVFKVISFVYWLFSYFSGCNGVMIFTTRSIFDDIGGFDDTIYAGEDIKFVSNLKKYAKNNKMQFKCIQKAHVITSARKFHTMGIRDYIWQVRLLLQPNLLKHKKNCMLWYDQDKRGE